jgi:hypothetical protein
MSTTRPHAGPIATWRTRLCERSGVVAARVPAGDSLRVALFLVAGEGAKINAPDFALVDRYLVLGRAGDKQEWYAPAVLSVSLRTKVKPNEHEDLRQAV